MITRREFTRQLAALSALPLLPTDVFAMPPAVRPSLIMDAMGEIRPEYPMALIDEILSSGTNSVTITLTDPKILGHEGFHQLLDDIALHDHYFESHADHFVKATSIADLERARREKKLAIFYLIQNASPIEAHPERVDMLYQLGLRSVQMTYNHQNLAGSGCMERRDSGLSTWGLQLIDKLNAKRMIIDLSHAGMTTMAETISASKAPVIISHSCCKTLYNHPRNTTDENLRLLADHGGVIGLTQIRVFMTKETKNNLDVYFNHIDHAVKVAGIDHVAIGSDRDHRIIPDSEEEVKQLIKEEGPNFHPEDWPLYLEKLNGPKRMEVIWDGLAKRGYTQAQLDKVMGQNVYRLYREVLG